MKRLFIPFSILLLVLTAFSQVAVASDISLYDKEGEAVAYIDTNDATIYLWGGKPVAYLDGTNIYGFNGNHIGWLEEGIIFDHDGNVAGFIKGAVNEPTQFESLKGLKELKPLKSLKELAPLKPLKSRMWSPTPLETSFTVRGRVKA